MIVKGLKPLCETENFCKPVAHVADCCHCMRKRYFDAYNSLFDAKREIFKVLEFLKFSWNDDAMVNLKKAFDDIDAIMCIFDTCVIESVKYGDA